MNPHPPPPTGRGEKAAEEPVWRTPVQLRFLENGTDRQERTLLSGGEAVTYEMGRAGSVLVNAGGHGFYRVRYAPELLRRCFGASTGWRPSSASTSSTTPGRRCSPA